MSASGKWREAMVKHLKRRLFLVHVKCYFSRVQLRQRIYYIFYINSACGWDFGCILWHWRFSPSVGTALQVLHITFCLYTQKKHPSGTFPALTILLSMMQASWLCWKSIHMQGWKHFWKTHIIKTITAWVSERRSFAYDRVFLCAVSPLSGNLYVHKYLIPLENVVLDFGTVVTWSL